MNDNSKFKLGLFIIFAAVIFFAALFILGAMDRFKEKAHLSTLVSESVQGLSVGSSVKYQGVPIGNVSEIMIYPTDNVIRIDMEINISKFKVQQPGHAPVTISVEDFNDNIEGAVKKGLCCRMELEGITGSKYIELQMEKEAVLSKFDVEEFGLDYTYVPSQPSLISDLRGSVTTILAKLESIDYKGLSDRTNAVLDSINERVNSPKFDETIDNVNGMVSEARKSIENLEKLTGSDLRDKVDAIAQNVKDAVAAVESLTKSVEVEIKAIEFGKIADDFRSFLSTARRTSKTLDETLFNVDNGIDAIIELIQYLDSDPSSLIQGKKKPKADQPAQGDGK